MRATTLYAGDAFSVYAYRCEAKPHDKPFEEVHASHSLSYVRHGSFGCRTRGEKHELVAGALMVGEPEREYTATHEHHCGGDECLSIEFSAEFAEQLCGKEVWDLAMLPPLPELMVLSELAWAAGEGKSDLGVDELGLLIAGKCAELAAGKRRAPIETSGKDRRRAVEAALWLDDNSAGEVNLEDAARQAGLSPFHFLRLFGKVIGATPHQYVLRSRLRRAARLLADEEQPITDVAFDCGFRDLSNFVRTFHRAAGVSPRRFRQAARGQRGILQARLAA